MIAFPPQNHPKGRSQLSYSHWKTRVIARLIIGLLVRSFSVKNKRGDRPQQIGDRVEGFFGSGEKGGKDENPEYGVV